MIDTTTTVSYKEEQKRDEVMESCMRALSDLQSRDLANNPSQHRDTVKTLLKVVANLIGAPLDPSVRRLSKTNKAV
jgi:hypothetical protein